MKSQFDELRSLLLEWGEDKHLPLLKKIIELEKENRRLRHQNQRLYQKNKSITERLRYLDGEAALRESNKKQYVVYKEKTDEIMIIGDISQCASYLGVSIDSFRWYLTPSGSKRLKSISIIDADEIDKDRD